MVKNEDVIAPLRVLSP